MGRANTARGGAEAMLLLAHLMTHLMTAASTSAWPWPYDWSRFPAAWFGSNTTHWESRYVLWLW